MTTTAYLINRALKDDNIIILEDLKPLCHELRKIGTNLNQLTMLAHRGQISCVDLTELSEEVKALWQPLNLLTERTNPNKRFFFIYHVCFFTPYRAKRQGVGAHHFYLVKRKLCRTIYRRVESRSKPQN